jgi:serine/threonine-protein kinase
MTTSVPWHRSLAIRFFLRTALTVLGLVLVVLWVARSQSRKQALENAEAGSRASAQIMENSFENRGQVLEAGLDVFTAYNRNMTGIEHQDFASVRESLLNNLASLKSDVAMVIRPTGALLSCTTDGYKQDYTDVGIVDMAMHGEDAPGPDREGGAYRGFFRIDGGSYKGSYMGVARRLKGHDGEFLGVMVVANRLDDHAAAQLQSQSMVRLHASDPVSHVTLVSHSEVVGTSVPAGEPRAALADWLGSPAGRSALEEAIAQGHSAPVPLVLEGRQVLAMLVGMKGVGAEALQMAKLITVPLDPYLRPFQKLQRAIVVTGLASLALALLLALTTARSVTAPLARLTEAVGKLAEGGRPDLPHPAHQDEVGALAKGFRVLLSELKAKEDLLAALEQLRGAQTSPGVHDQTASLPTGQDATDQIRRTPEVGTGPLKRPAAPGKLHLRVGDTLAGRYRIDRIAATGGMGLVVKAYDLELDDDVALKVIRPELVGEPGFLDRLKQEIKLARRISHKHILRTHDFGETGGVPFVTMEYLRGTTLRQLLDDRKRLPLSLVLRIGRQMAEGLQAAHAEGVVHRDIKPSNVMFDAQGEVKLMDFGLAAPVSGRGTDAEGQIFGTPGYMAPEQILGDQVDPRTDLYALGVVLYELATGVTPFQSEDRIGLLRLHMEADPPDAREVNPRLPAGFAVLVRALMARAKEARPAAAQEVIALLHQVAEHA